MSTKSLTHQQTADLCSSLSELLQSGFSSGEACHLLFTEESGDMRTLLDQLRNQTDVGISLGEALLRAQCFPPVTAGLIHTGEQTGYLVEALTFAAQYHQIREETVRQLRSALGYPFLLLGLMITVLGVLLIQVFPVFDSVYASLGCSMTGLAAGFLKLGQLLKQALPFLFLLLVVIAAFALAFHFDSPLRKALTQAFGRLIDDRWLIREFLNAQFLQAFSMGIRSGLSPEAAVELAGKLLNTSSGASSRCLQALEAIRGGTDFPEALFSAKLIDGYGCRILSLGSKSGNIDQITVKLGERMHTQAENHLQAHLSRIEPAIVLICSALVGLILLSVMLPLMQVLSALG